MKKILYVVLVGFMLSCGEESLNQSPTVFTLTISEITRTSATATWTEATDPEAETLSYFLYFYKVDDLQNPLKDGESMTVSIYQFQDLEPDTEYKVTIAAVDQSGNTRSAVQTFTTEAEPAPSEFTVSVSDETSTSVSLDWTESIDPDGGEITYSVMLNDEILAENLTVLEYAIEGLTPGAFYSGKIVAVNAAQKTTESLFNFVASALNPSILMYYGFCGDAADVVGGNNGSLQGTVTPVPDRNGVENCAYGFPGTDADYISIAYSEDFDFAPDANFSISLWYQGGSENGADLEFFVTKENLLNSPVASDYHVGLYDCNKVSFGSIHSPIAFGDPGNSCGSAPNSLWHHIVAVYEQNAGSTRWAIYIDGLLADTIDTSERIVQSANGLKIGQFFQGNIDDVVFFSKSLTAAEVQSVQDWQ